MDDSLSAAFVKAGLPGAARHLFLCVGPDCCAPESGAATWEYIKRRVRETGIPAMRTRAACFRICQGGPWLVVYPEGIWYGRVDPPRFERILQEHLLAGRPVAEWVDARQPLGSGGDREVL